MTSPKSAKDRIYEEFSSLHKEYAAFDRTLDALSALSFVLQNVTEIRDETELVDFTPKLESGDLDSNPYTPDGLIIQRPDIDFTLELKTSWNDADVRQVIKYAKSPSYILKMGAAVLSNPSDASFWRTRIHLEKRTLISFLTLGRLTN